MVTKAPTRDVASRPRERSSPTHLSDADPWTLLDVARLAEWLGVEVVFVRRLVAERRIPFVKIGKFVRFEPGEVAAWIRSQRVTPTIRSSRNSRRIR